MPADPLQIAESLDANVPVPPREHGVWLLAGALALLGAAVLFGALLLGGRSAVADAKRSRRPRCRSSPRRPRRAPRPRPACSHARLLPSAIGARSTRGGRRRAIVTRPSSAQQQLDASRFVGETQTHVSTRWMEGFYPIYAIAQRTFGGQLAAARLDPQPGVGVLDGA